MRTRINKVLEQFQTVSSLFYQCFQLCVLKYFLSVAAAKPAEKSASELLRDERAARTEEGGVAGSTLSQFQPALGRGLAPGCLVDFTSSPRHRPHPSTRLATGKKVHH